MKKIVILTGSGISQESGLATFRGADGLWEGHRVEDVATPEAFQRNPEVVYDFYNRRRQQLQPDEVQPNAAHFALAEFEANFTGDFTLVTQNVDDLHERAGSKNILHMHGELLKVRDMRNGKLKHWTEDLDGKSSFPGEPETEGQLRPHIVWFGEMPLFLDEIQELVSRADLFVAIGTSGLVYPAAGFVEECARECRKVEINMEGTQISNRFDEHFLGKASEVVPDFFRKIVS